MFQGNIYRIMIGCPSDIEEEVKIAKRIIHQWSCLNAESHNIVLLPLHWSDNSYPEYGAHPQKMLDKQLVEKSDMLICIFGSRIGTETDTSDSGSIEEIEEHIKNGKPVMVFFKKSLSDIHSVDIEQLEKLNIFREKIRNKILWCDYGDSLEFETLLQKKLTLYINDNWLTTALANNDKSSVNTDFTDEELRIFSKWANDKVDNTYIHMAVIGGRNNIHLAYQYSISLENAQQLAWWEDFMERLMSHNYIKLNKYDEYGHPLYKITMQGYSFAKSLAVDI